MSQGQAEPWEILQVESCFHQRYSSLVPQSLEIWCCLETRSLQMQSSCSDLQQGLKQWLVSALPGRFKHQDFFLSPSHLWDLMLEMINLLEEKFILALGVKGFNPCSVGPVTLDSGGKYHSPAGQGILAVGIQGLPAAREGNGILTRVLQLCSSGGQFPQQNHYTLFRLSCHFGLWGETEHHDWVRGGEMHFLTCGSFRYKERWRREAGVSTHTHTTPGHFPSDLFSSY